MVEVCKVLGQSHEPCNNNEDCHIEFLPPSLHTIRFFFLREQMRILKATMQQFTMCFHVVLWKFMPLADVGDMFVISVNTLGEPGEQAPPNSSLGWKVPKPTSRWFHDFLVA